MSIIKCPECESGISNLASSCPQCGFPLSNDKMKSRIGIPAIPKEIWDGLQKASLSSRFLNWKVYEGDWVKEGDILASYNVKSFKATHYERGKIWTEASIIAPVSGKISKINRIEYANWDWSNLTTSESSWRWENDEDNAVNLTDEKIIVFLDTPKKISYTARAYSCYENIVDYGYFARSRVDRGFFKKSSFENTDFPPSCLEGLANSDVSLKEI